LDGDQGTQREVRNCPPKRVKSTDEERKIVTEKGARRFDRFEQWLMRHLVDPESLYSRLRTQAPSTEEGFGKKTD